MLLAAAAIIMGGNAALFLGWLTDRILGGVLNRPGTPLWAFCGVAALMGLAFTGLSGVWWAFPLGAAAVGYSLLHLEYRADYRRLTLAQRGFFNSVVSVGIAAFFGLPALVASMAISFAITGKAEPRYFVAAFVAIAVAAVIVVRFGRQRRAAAAKEADLVVQAFE